MRARTLAIIGTAMLLGTCLLKAQSSPAKSGSHSVVRIAELEIDPNQLETYKAVLREEIATSIRAEPGVLTLYAVSVKDHPTQIRLFEMYANAAAYEQHLQSPHFKKYKSESAGMVKSLNLIETDPILLGAK
jgi:quinol monooxygenase YgiN